MHHEVMHFVYETKALYPQFFTNARVLEIGSLKIGDQPSVKAHFNDCDYVGVDIGEGPNVDVVCKGHEYTSNELFDLVISCECFEHDPYYDLTVTNMINLLRPEGMLLFTCATTGRPEHGTTSANPESSPLTTQIEGWKDHYRNLTEIDFRRIPIFNQMVCGYWATNELSRDLYYRGWKKK